MDYYYQGALRLQLLFDSPNKLAAFIVLVLPSLIAFVAVLWYRGGRKTIGVALLFAVLALTGIVCLVLTYSRGGYVSFAIGLFVLAVAGFRRVAMFVAVIFCALLLAIPNAAVRAVSMDVVHDMSIHNRIVLWQSVCEMCADSPLFGIGRSVGDVYMAWRQPFERMQRYSTAVNDYLTIGARYGMVVLALWMFVIILVAFGLLRTARVKCSPVMAALAAGVISYATAAMFSTFYTTPFLFISFAVALLLGVFLIVRNGLCAGCGHVMKAMFMALAVCVSILGFGILSRADDRLRYSYFCINGIDSVMVRKGVDDVSSVVMSGFMIG